ncbi:MAG: hypothetical protein H6816_04205 [Phycisphaerales bacterium]|nr:hypothetical protein [Phycisphaerales bacterium]
MIFTDWQEFRTPDFTMIRKRPQSAGDLRRRNLTSATLARMGISTTASARRAASK